MPIAISDTTLSTDYKITPLDTATSMIVGWRKNGWKVGMVMGTFDIVHILQWRFLNFAKNKCDKLVVTINNDESVKRTKGENRPVFDQQIRCQMVSSCQFADLVIPVDNPQASFVGNAGDIFMKTLIQKLSPDLVFSNPISDYQVQTKKDTIEQLGGQFILYEEPEDIKQLISSTKLLEKLNSI